MFVCVRVLVCGLLFAGLGFSVIAMDPYEFLRAMDSRSPLTGLSGINSLNPLSSLSGLGLDPPLADVRGRTKIAREEAALEAKVVQIIASGDWESLKPNSGKAIAIGEHHICVAHHEDADSGYRIWEWHGHLLMFDEDEGYTPEYIYGNHFQPMQKKEEPDETNVVNGVGLGGIIGGDDKKKQGPILHRNVRKDSSTSKKTGK